MNKSVLRAGIDIGSTTVKLAILDPDGKILFGEYLRHRAQTRETLRQLIERASEQIGDATLSVSITGSGALGIARSLGLPIVQEVVSVATAISTYQPETDVADELGADQQRDVQHLRQVQRGPRGAVQHERDQLDKSGEQGQQRVLCLDRDVHEPVHPI
ncbi:MAG: ROK family protein [Clostridia bacterium]|nr:ROK family protein [Clostridia bacterium]